MMFFGKPIEYCVALVTGMLIVVDRHRNKGALSRALVAAISGGIGHSLSADFAAWTGRSETLAVMILTAVGYLLMDTLMALVSDREWIKEILKSKLTGGK